MIYSSHPISDPASLRQVYRPPTARILDKRVHRLDSHARDFIRLSPFVLLATSDGRSSADVSPRGGPPGHVAVLDEHHLLLPDRPGNNRLDSFSNILRFPFVSLLFIVPGVLETLRVKGRAALSTDAALLEAHGAGGAAKAVLLVEVLEARLHCAQALELAGLWRPSTWPDRRLLAPAGRIWADHVRESERQRKHEHEHEHVAAGRCPD